MRGPDEGASEMTQRAEIRRFKTLPLKVAISKHLTQWDRSHWRDRRRKPSRASPRMRTRKEGFLRIRKFIVTPYQETEPFDQALEERRQASRGSALPVSAETVLASSIPWVPDHNEASFEEDLAPNNDTPDSQTSETPSSSELLPRSPSPSGIRVSKTRRRNQKKKTQRRKLKEESRALKSVRRRLTESSGQDQGQGSRDTPAAKTTVAQASAREFQWGELSESFTLSLDLDSQGADSLASALSPSPKPQFSIRRRHAQKKKAQRLTQENETWRNMLSELSGNISTSSATAPKSKGDAAAAREYLDTVPRGTVLHRFLKDLETQNRKRQGTLGAKDEQ